MDTVGPGPGHRLVACPPFSLLQALFYTSRNLLHTQVKSPKLQVQIQFTFHHKELCCSYPWELGDVRWIGKKSTEVLTVGLGLLGQKSLDLSSLV